MPSSVVAVYKYDKISATLRITYTSGKIYDYKDVPAAVYEEMKLADSKGTFLNFEIKGNYQYKEIK